MAESDVIQAMVLTFRISELQTLMTFAGKSKSGRKTELQARALELVRLNTSDINLKIRELSNAMYKSIGSAPSVNPYSNNYTDSPADPSPPEKPTYTRSIRKTRSRISYAELDPDSPPSSGYSSSQSSMSDYLIYGSNGGGSSGGTKKKKKSSSDKSDGTLPVALPKQVVVAPPPEVPPPPKVTVPSPLATFEDKPKLLHNQPSATSNNSHLVYPPCPDVKLNKLPFYKVEATLLMPSSLQPTGNARFQDQNFSFHLTPKQANAIASSCYRDNMGRPEYKRQIQMRFCLLETSCEQEDNFPASISVKVNGRIQPLPNPIPTNKPGVEPKRPPKPINITGLCKLSATVPNYLNISWTVEAGRGYTVSVYYVDKLSSGDLMRMMKERGQRHPDYTRAIIKDKLNDKDSEIATTSCKVTLACPLGKMRMTYPCRASTCDHLQCFDASLYLQMNERKPKWVCPVCNKQALYDNLLLDGYFMEVLTSSRLPPGEHEIVLHNDATWEPLPPRKDGEPSRTGRVPKPSPAAAPRDVETFSVDDDDDDEEDVDVEKDQPDSVPGNEPRPTGGKRPVEAVDCITLDDSDDEEGTEEEVVRPPHKRHRPGAFLDDSPISLSDTATPSGSPSLEEAAAVARAAAAIASSVSSNTTEILGTSSSNSSNSSRSSSVIVSSTITNTTSETTTLPMMTTTPPLSMMAPPTPLTSVPTTVTGSFLPPPLLPTPIPATMPPRLPPPPPPPTTAAVTKSKEPPQVICIDDDDDD